MGKKGSGNGAFLLCPRLDWSAFERVDFPVEKNVEIPFLEKIRISGR